MGSSLVDVAQLAGVAPSTVSKAFTDRYSINQTTRNRILEVAKRLDYAPSATGRALALGKTHTIGVYYRHGGLPNALLGTMLEGSEDIFKKAGYRIMVITQSETKTDINQAVRQRFVDGMIISHCRDDRLQAFMHDKNFPYVLMNAEQDSSSDFVMGDNKEGIKHAVEYLYGLGHRKIAFINGPRYAHITHKLRAEAYIEAMALKGLPAIPGYNKHIPVQERLTELLDKPDVPTALLCFNDDIAIEIIGSLLRRGIKVPQNISVIGCDDNTEMVKHCYPSLTTIHVPFKEMGSEAARLLLMRIEDPNHAIEVRILKQNLVVRESTGPVVGQ